MAPAVSTTPVTALLGRLDDPRYAGRAVDPVDVAWGDAAKHRRRVRSAAGRELDLRLPRGTFLADGAVVDDDGTTVTVVRRPPEEAIVVPLTGCGDASAARGLLLLGHRLGNQHAPVEVTGTELRTPLLTGAATAEATLAALGVPGEVRRVPLAAHGWSSTSADHARGHDHE